MVVGIWGGQTEALSSAMYEIVPGFLACLVVAVVVSLLTAREDDEIQREFSEMAERAEETREAAASA